MEDQIDKERIDLIDFLNDVILERGRLLDKIKADVQNAALWEEYDDLLREEQERRTIVRTWWDRPGWIRPETEGNA